MFKSKGLERVQILRYITCTVALIKFINLSALVYPSIKWNSNNCLIGFKIRGHRDKLLLITSCHSGFFFNYSVHFFVPCLYFWHFLPLEYLLFFVSCGLMSVPVGVRPVLSRMMLQCYVQLPYLAIFWSLTINSNTSVN